MIVETNCLNDCFLSLFFIFYWCIWVDVIGNGSFSDVVLPFPISFWWAIQRTFLFWMKKWNSPVPFCPFSVGFAIVVANPNRVYDLVDVTWCAVCWHYPSPSPMPELKIIPPIFSSIEMMHKHDCITIVCMSDRDIWLWKCDSPSMLRLVNRLPVRLRSNCGAGRSTGVLLVWYMVRPE